MTALTLSIEKQELIQLVVRQLTNMFMFKESELPILLHSIERALEKCRACFAPNPNKYFRQDGAIYFNPFHSGQYSIFLYYLSNDVWRENPRCALLADRIYCLNKALHGCDFFYEVELPAIFSLDHPVGSVMGRASYGDYFRFCQNCTVGNNKGLFPRLGQNVTMLAGSTVLGACSVGDDVIVSAGTFIKDTDIPAHTLVFGTSPNLVIKPNPYPTKWNIDN
jgi:serine O-acetyltransferase